MRIFQRALVGALIVLPPSPASPQDAVPEVRSDLVQLDVVVTDGKGQLVRGLSSEDFEVREDGKPQPLVHFVPAGPSSRPPRAPREAAPSSPVLPGAVAEERADPGPGRNIVIVVDDLHIAGTNLVNARNALTRLVHELVASEDHVAVVTTGAGLLHPLTEDRATLAQAIGRLTPRDAAGAQPRGSQMTPAEAEMILRGESSAVQLVARAKVEEPGNTFDGPRAASDSGPTMGLLEASPAEKEAAKEAERQARGVLGEALRYSTATLSTVESVLRGLAPMPGRKICLLISDGFLVGTGTSEARTRDVQRLIDGATRSGAVVYTLDSRGLAGIGGDAAVAGSGRTTGAAAGLQARVDRLAEALLRDTLEQVANNTGGFLVRGTNDLALGLRRMLDDNGAYYLMAYAPANAKRDGRFRKIEVRVPRHSGYVVRTRRGYLAPAPDDTRQMSRLDVRTVPRAFASPASPVQDDQDEQDARATLAAPLLKQGIPVRLTADFLDLPPEGPQALLRARIDPSGLEWREAGGRHHATVALVGGFYDAQGNAVGTTFARRRELALTTPEREEMMETGLSFQERVPLKPGRYQVKLVARSLSQSGGAAEWLEIADLSDRKLALSSLFLSGSGADADTHSVRRFKRGSTLAFQIYVYNPSLGDHARDVVLQAQIWGAGKVIAASRPTPVAFETKDGGPLPETNSLPLEGLSAGPYELRVVVVDGKAGTQAARKVDFTVE